MVKKLFAFIIVLQLLILDGLHANNTVIVWNNATLDAIITSQSPPTVAARALAIVHTCIFDAWAAYDDCAVGTQLGESLRRPKKEHTQANKKEALSYAAFKALVDLFPNQAVQFSETMIRLGYSPFDNSFDPTTPVGVGNLAAQAVLTFRQNDGSNQLGNEPGSNGFPYSDYTGYVPVNTPDILIYPSKWQPLTSQVFVTPQWGFVIPFALTSGAQFIPPPPAHYLTEKYVNQTHELLKFNANLTNERIAIAVYWADIDGTFTPPGHWNNIAQFISAKHNQTLDDDVKMFFALDNALLDASISAWYIKKFYNSVRPISAIRFLYNGTYILAWGGPGQGTKLINGANWQSYIPTPSFPEFISGHSTFSSAAAEVLKLFTGSDKYGAQAYIAKGSSFVEPGFAPTATVALSWKTLKEAANQAGLSRRIGGIHFKDADLIGRKIGKQIGEQAFEKALTYFYGS